MKEIRSTDIGTVKESRTVEGYSIVFNSLSKDLGGFKEIIDPSAIDEDTIRRSDILFLLDHNKERGVLARSQYGEGSLKIDINDLGVRFEFEAPNTALGDEVLEGLRRNDINKCSFAFIVDEDEWSKDADGQVLRKITKIDRLFDLSAVINPAYENTIIINKRGYEELMEQENKEIRAEEECKEKEVEENTEEVEEEENKPAEEQEETEESAEDNEEENKENDKSEDKRKINSDNLYNKEIKPIKRNMSKKFSLVNAINAVVNNRSFDEVTENVIKEGRNIANLSGLSMNGQIVLPVESRADGDTPTADASTKPVNGIMATEATYGKEIVPTEIWDIEGALRDRLVLADAGAQFITANSNIEIPVYDGNNVYWESEIGMAQDGAGKFSKVSLSPKRLTAFVDISKMLLNQTSESIEAMLREDLINAVAEKLQKTILGNGKGSDVEPKGMFDGVTADTAAFTFNDAVDMEAALESANVYGDYRYVVSPSAKAALRVLPVDKGSGKFVFEDNEVLGIGAHSTNSVVNKGVVLGDFRQMIIANFGAMDLTVDTVSRAAYGQIRLVVNFYVDYAVKRPEAFVKRILK